MKHAVVHSDENVAFDIIDYDEDYATELKAICGSFYHDLSRIFPKRLASYVLLTRKSRRRIWFAYLAGKKQLRIVRHVEELRQKLLYGSAKMLLQDAYGDLPEGFLGVVKSPAVDDLSAKGYMHLYDLLAAGKVNALHLHGQQLDDRLLEVMLCLPDEVCTVKVAKLFPYERHWKKFINQISTFEFLSGRNLHQHAYEGLLGGMKPETILSSYLVHLAFDAPVLTPCGNIQHIINAKELFHTAKVFENCLARNLPEALTSHQFYIYTAQNKDQYVFSITQFARNHWKLDEIQKKDEMFTSLDELPDLAFYLEQQGIHTDNSDTYRMLKSIMNL